MVTIRSESHSERYVVNRDNDFDDRIRERLERQREQAEPRSESEWEPPTETPYQMLRRMNREGKRKV